MSKLPKGWELIKLNQLGTFSKGKGISKSEVTESGYPCIRYAEIYTKYDYVIHKIKSYINEESAQNSNELKQYDILFAGSGETVEDIGKSVAFISDCKTFVGGDTVVFTPKENILDSVYMSYQLNNNETRKQLRKLAQGNSVVHIYSKGLMNIKVNFPPLEEQKKIAEILSTVDRKIAFVDNQIEENEVLKKGLMQKLLTEGIGHSEFKDSEIGRIPVDWKVVKLKNILQIGSGKDYKKLKIGNIPVYGTGGYMLSVDDYLYDGESACIGRKGTIDKPMFLSGKFWTVDTLFYTHSYINSIPKFIYYLFSSIKWKQYNEASGVPSLSKKTIEVIKISLPPLQEQKQIAEILSKADDKIEILREKKESFKELKKGLMQKLLTGEVRV